MKLTQKLAYSQIKKTRNRALWTLIGIALSTAMITAVFGFAASGHIMMMKAAGGNEFYIKMYNTTLFGLGAFFSSLVVAASVIVVSNVFRVSAGERVMQFGILKSVGATKKQIAQTIMYEGVYLCVVGIPVGLALGLLVNYIGIQIVNTFLDGLASVNSEPLMAQFVVAWQAVILAVVISFLTVWLSAWLPARKAARIPAIDAIRGAGEVKVKAKHIRSNRLVSKLFGFEGTLASKSLKRNKRNFRATVVSLTVSVTLFIAVGSFGAQMNNMTATYWPDINADAAVTLDSPPQVTYGDDGKLTEWSVGPADGFLANAIADKLREYPDTEIFGAGNDSSNYTVYGTVLPENTLTAQMREACEYYGFEPRNGEYDLPVSFISVDEENYAALCKRAGVPVGSNILVNQYTWYHDGGRSVFAPYVFEGQTIRIESALDGSEFELPLHGVLMGTDIPGEVLHAVFGSIAVIVPEAPVGYYCWFANCDDKNGFIEYAYGVMNEFFPKDKEAAASVEVLDVEEALKSEQRVARMIMVFVYGFVGMLTLIGLTNVISTISANVRSRSREFAILRSAGMTDGGLKRMLNLESILCSAKALVYGVPLGFAGSYLSYMALDMPVAFSYEIPWVPIVQCTLVVFAITWVTMRYSAARLRGGNIVEAIRNEAV